jgi:hypothetical protein
MAKFGRVVTPVAIAAVAMAGPVVFGASSASAAQLHAVSGSTVAGPIRCDPAELQAKADAHSQKAAEYQNLLDNELSKANPNPKKVARYEKMVSAHTQKAEAYRASAQQCEDAVADAVR